MNHFDMELTQRQAKKYKRATKKQKGAIITQYCQLTGVTRNLASKRFRKVLRDIHPWVLKANKPSGKRKGRRPTYTSIHRAIVKKAWELSDEICGERLHPIIGTYVKQLENNDLLKYYGKRYIRETKQISEPTLKRVIAGFPKTSTKHKQKGNASIYKEIPIHAYFGKNAYRPGYIEIDYVEHSGGHAKGHFAITGTYVDVCLGWTVRTAALGKSQQAVGRIHDNNEKKVYHRIHEYHPDNAKPILKLLLEKKMGDKPPDYHISRSRPYHKEDNGHVEQKNGDKVRKLVGYHRYDTEEQVMLLNKLYEVEDLISNFFLPSQKLIEKIKDERGRVIRKKYDKAQTAYQRLMHTDGVKETAKQKVQKIYTSLNLVMLRKQSEELQQQLLQTVISRKNIMI
jgi:hypothetical protein